MSVKGCVIGNSHVAALKLGWTLVGADYPDIDLDFFAVPRQLLRKVVIRKGALVTKDEFVAENLRQTGGSDSISLAPYDFFIVVGGGGSSRPLFRMQANHMPFSGTNSGEMYISESYLRECYRAHVQKSSARHIIDLLAKATTAPVFYVPDPHLSNDPETLTREVEDVAKVRARGSFDLSQAIFTETIASVFADAREILFQPPETLDGALLTKVEYARGMGQRQPVSESDDDEASFGDIVHLNGKYGTLFWQTFFRDHNLSQAS